MNYETIFMNLELSSRKEEYGDSFSSKEELFKKLEKGLSTLELKDNSFSVSLEFWTADTETGIPIDYDSLLTSREKLRAAIESFPSEILALRVMNNEVAIKLVNKMLI